MFGVVGLLVFVFVVIPLLLFGIELVIAGSVIAGSVIGRLLLGRPWLIQATTAGGPGGKRHIEWEVSGWGRSQALLKQVSADIAAGRNPQPGILRFDCSDEPAGRSPRL